MKNLILVLIACIMHIGIHQLVRHYGLLSNGANANLLFLALFASFAAGMTTNLKTNNSQYE
jgi:hypothetical protein